jgi:hypothetical protein
MRKDQDLSYGAVATADSLIRRVLAEIMQIEAMLAISINNRICFKIRFLLKPPMITFLIRLIKRYSCMSLYIL